MRSWQCKRDCRTRHSWGAASHRVSREPGLQAPPAPASPPQLFGDWEALRTNLGSDFEWGIEQKKARGEYDLARIASTDAKPSIEGEPPNARSRRGDRPSSGSDHDRPQYIAPEPPVLQLVKGDGLARFEGIGAVPVRLKAIVGVRGACPAVHAGVYYLKQHMRQRWRICCSTFMTVPRPRPGGRRPRSRRRITGGTRPACRGCRRRGPAGGPASTIATALCNVGVSIPTNASLSLFMARPLCIEDRPRHPGNPRPIAHTGRATSKHRGHAVLREMRWSEDVGEPQAAWG
jgi:hypothetical protein